MLTKEIKNKLISMVTEELDNCELYIGNPENTFLFSTIEEQERYEGCFSWKYACGATKLVLFPPEMDYIIKIPFNGFRMEFDEYEDNFYTENPVPSMLASCFDYDKMRMRIEDMYYEEDPSNIFEPFHGAVLNGEMIENDWNYCELEHKISEYAAEEGLGDLFVPTEFLFNYNGYPIYVQKKCEIEHNFDLSSYSCTEEDKIISNETLPHHCLGYLEGTSWLATALKEYGKEKIDALIDFIIEYNLSDLRDENRGLYNGKPVLVDYCGFCE